ncbi:hypothetical protein KI387_043342, partial [Taxus chinensis]
AVEYEDHGGGVAHCDAGVVEYDNNDVGAVGYDENDVGVANIDVGVAADVDDRDA